MRAANSWLGQMAMCIYRRKLRRILRKRAARSCCTDPKAIRTFNSSHAKKIAFFTLPVESAGRDCAWAVVARLAQDAGNPFARFPTLY